MTDRSVIVRVCDDDGSLLVVADTQLLATSREVVKAAQESLAIGPTG